MLTDQSIQIDYGKIEQRDISAFDKRLTKKLEILNKHLKSSDPDKLKIRIQQPKESQYYVDLTLFNSITIHTNGKGNNVVIALENAFTPLKENLLQQLNKQKDKQADRSPRQLRSQTLNQAYGTLQNLVVTQDIKSFSKELLPLLKDLKAYIFRRLRYAHLIGLDKDRTVTSSEVLNKTVETAYKRFDSKRVDVSLEHWLFAIADQILSNDLKEADFESAHMEDWDDYVDAALSDMDQQFTISAEGNPEMVEDLDDTNNSLNIDAEQMGFTVNYIENMSNKDQVVKIMKALSKIPPSKRKIFELHAIEGFSEEEISRIHGIKPKQVQETIDEVRKSVMIQL